jgi:hypothetical protein
MTTSMRETMQQITNMLIDLAGNQILPPEIKIYEDVIDQSKILQNIESNIAAFIKDYPNFAKSIHDKAKKQEIIQEIYAIINSFEFETSTFLIVKVEGVTENSSDNAIAFAFLATIVKYVLTFKAPMGDLPTVKEQPLAVQVVAIPVAEPFGVIEALTS